MAQMGDRVVNWTGTRLSVRRLGREDVRRARSWSASGRQSPSARGSTRPTRPPPGARTWTGSSAGPRELNERAFDAIHYRGPGTDLTVGLLDQARWMSARFETADGIEYVPNMPTEEVFTTPDCRRADGVITASRPARARRRRRSKG